MSIEDTGDYIIVVDHINKTFSNGVKALVDFSTRVSRGEVLVVIGPSGSGKSTFLRSLGVNMVLAYAGCPVCAESFQCTYMGMYSSMRTADSLKDEESYFLAEIKRLAECTASGARGTGRAGLGACR